MKLPSSFLYREGTWEISFVPLEWCLGNKWIHLTGYVTAVSYCIIFGCTSVMEILWRLFALLSKISFEKKKKQRWTLLYALCFHVLHSRTKFGIGDFVCLRVVSLVHSSVRNRYLYLFFEVTEIQKQMPCVAVWCCALSPCGPRADPPAEHLQPWELGWQCSILCRWRKGNAVLTSVTNLPLKHGL